MKEKRNTLNRDSLRIAVLSIHSSPLGKLGTQDTGGMSVYIRELCHELGKAGHTVDIYTRSDGLSGNHEVSLFDNVRLIHLPAGNNGRISKNMLYPYLPEIFRKLEAYRLRNNLSYDIIHSHYWLSGKVGSWAQRQWNVPHLLMFHTNGFMKRVRCAEEREPAMRLINEKRLTRECSRLLSPTEKEKDYIVRFYGTQREKIGLVPCGVNLDRFRPIPKREARKRLGLQADEAIILYVGRFAPVKGLDRLFAAMAHLKKYSRLSLMVVGGDGNQAQSSLEFERLTKVFGIRDAVTFAGRVEHNDLSKYYSAADVLVVPSYYESFGLVALESLACGTPVVATPVGAIDKIVQDGTTGVVVKKPSPRSLASAIKRFVSSSAKKDLSRDDVRASVLRHCWSGVASTVVKEYSKVISDVMCERA
jgi:D-inositol-3-phosphate glycosyltransferase